jgi:ATP-dependent DNA helicase PIF1
MTTALIIKSSAHVKSSTPFQGGVALSSSKGGGGSHYSAAIYLDASQQSALDLIRSGKNVFLSGRAGTGKSTVIGEYIGSAFNPVEVTATTGIAAINLQDAFLLKTGLMLRAMTIYRWAGIGIGPKLGESFLEFFNSLEVNMYPARMAAFNRIRRADTLLIDEVSMLPGRILDYLDFHCRQIRGVDRPFGGIQVIAVGDFLQLPPVTKTGNYDWAFQSQAWRTADFASAFLQTIHRQDEPDFINALNDFREGRIRGATAQTLAKRIARFPDRNITRLMTHNTQVNKWNSYSLGCIEDEQERIFIAECEGPPKEVEFLRKNMITPWELHLKRGARVMVTRNLSDGGDLIAANGATGTVEEFSFDGRIGIILDSGRDIQIEKHTFHFDPMRRESGSVTQYPLRLAYAMTIHKSQGLTLDRAMIDIRAAREPGQAYVALSRLKGLSGLYLKDWIKGIFVSQEAINFYRNLKS